MREQEQEKYDKWLDIAKFNVAQIKTAKNSRKVGIKEAKKNLHKVIEAVATMTMIYGHNEHYDKLKDFCWKHILDERSTEICEELLEG